MPTFTWFQWLDTLNTSITWKREKNVARKLLEVSEKARHCIWSHRESVMQQDQAVWGMMETSGLESQTFDSQKHVLLCGKSLSLTSVTAPPPTSNSGVMAKGPGTPLGLPLLQHLMKHRLLHFWDGVQKHLHHASVYPKKNKQNTSITSIYFNTVWY